MGGRHARRGVDLNKSRGVSDGSSREDASDLFVLTVSAANKSLAQKTVLREAKRSVFLPLTLSRCCPTLSSLINVQVSPHFV